VTKLGVWVFVSLVRFVQWRSVFYVAGDLNNFLLLLDAFFVWKEKSIAQSQPFQVEIHPYLDSHQAGHVWDDLDYKEDVFCFET